MPNQQDGSSSPVGREGVAEKGGRAKIYKSGCACKKYSFKYVCVVDGDCQFKPVIYRFMVNSSQRALF